MPKKLSILVVLCALPWLLAAGDSDKLQQDRAALKELQDYVGQWRGSGFPRRGSTRGAWQETTDWAWKFDKNSAAFEFKTDDGKYFSSGQLTATDKPHEYRLVCQTKDDKSESEYVGTLDERKKLVLDATKPTDDLPHRVSIRMVADGKRLVVLLERRLGTSDKFLRVAEIGYTREGSGFGKGVSDPECVVTGGYGNIVVTHKGKKYLVCCTGCRDYFNENPEKVLAEYFAKKKAEKKEAKE